MITIRQTGAVRYRQGMTDETNAISRKFGFPLNVAECKADVTSPSIGLFQRLKLTSHRMRWRAMNCAGKKVNDGLLQRNNATKNQVSRREIKHLVMLFVFFTYWWNVPTCGTFVKNISRCLLLVGRKH